MEAAPAQSPVSSPASSPSPTQGGEAGGSFDFNEAFSEAKRARAEASQLRSAFDKQAKEYSGTKETLDRVQKAFNPDKAEAAPDPVADLEQQMDYYLEQAMEAKQRGQPIPLTTNLALRFFQAQISNHKTIEQLNDKIAKLEGGVNQATDPQAHVNNMAYATMENQIQRSLDQLYGTGDESFATKQGMYQSVVKMISSNLKELQSKAPGKWDQVRRDPNSLNKIVSQAVRSLIPPKALGLIEQDHLQNTPMSKGELWAAFREAKAAGRMDVARRIRQDLVGGVFDERKPQRR